MTYIYISGTYLNTELRSLSVIKIVRLPLCVLNNVSSTVSHPHLMSNLIQVYQIIKAKRHKKSTHKTKQTIKLHFYINYIKNVYQWQCNANQSRYHPVEDLWSNNASYSCQLLICTDHFSKPIFLNYLESNFTGAKRRLLDRYPAYVANFNKLLRYFFHHLSIFFFRGDTTGPHKNYNQF